MVFNQRALLRLLVPALLLPLALVLRPYIPSLGAEALTLLTSLPYLLAIVSGVLALQFNRSRFLLLTLLTAGAYWLIQSKLQVSLNEPAAAMTYGAVGLGLPAIFLFLLLVPERGIWNMFGPVYLVCVVCLGFVAYLLAGFMPAWFTTQSQWLALWPGEYYVLPLAISIAHGLSLTTALVILCWRDSETEAALLTTLLGGSLLLALFYLPNLSVALFSALCISQLISVLRSSHAMAYRDELTGLLGRRALNERMRGLGGSYSLAMLDVDHFKKFNDTHGHDVGDEVLKLVAAQIDKVGVGGTAFRYGGEEFCIVFPRRSAERCVGALEQVRDSIASYEMVLRDKSQRPQKKGDGSQRRGRKSTTKTVSVTISLGLAERSEENPRPVDVSKAADAHLYKAKQSGRNCLSYQGR
jgi:diguanylate cyclase (GGDEF)-like protein